MLPIHALGCPVRTALVNLFLSMLLTTAETVTSQPGALRFEVRLSPAPTATNGGPARPDTRPRSGRLLVIAGKPGAIEPRFTVGETGTNTPPILGRDIADLVPDSVAVLDHQSVIFPVDSLSQLRPGNYAVQALLHTNADLNVPNAPGDLFSSVTTVRLDPAAGGTIRLELSHVVPAEALPPDQELIKYLKVRSRLLSDFHGRPIDLRAGVILPRDFLRHPEQRYPVRVHIGGYGGRFTDVGTMMSPETDFHRAWMADQAPRMILIHLDGAGPLGDPYQIDSANNGPYGAAVTRELIPMIEEKFRGIGKGHSRVVDGGSTGGWVALALQVFYPDFFNGAWAFCPDSVDFRSFQLVNIYDDANAYINRHGFERPASRDVSGEVRYTMRHECQLENSLGRGDSWTLSGAQWGAWNAAYGARGPDGRPVPLWNPITGAIDHQAAAHWKKYDLRSILEDNWTELGPKLQGKIHIWVGDADNFFLNNAVRKLGAFLSHAQPPYQGSITFGPGQGHCWMGIAETAMMKQMAQRASVHPPAATPLAPSRD
jgi:S-formylglutathione hydrolase FrmB